MLNYLYFFIIIYIILMKLLKFTDGADIYKDFNTAYKRHKKGYIILGPPGIGKTYFVDSQKGKKKIGLMLINLLNKILKMKTLHKTTYRTSIIS